jgi:hypothetical protein
MTSTRTIEALLTIMDDPDIVTNRRVEAAEMLLGFEAPDDTVLRARDFLMSVFDNKEESISDRMNAIRIKHKSEASKVTPKIVRLEVKGRDEADRREAWRQYEKSELKRKIWRATGEFPPPGWADMFGDDYLPPPGDEWPPWGKKAQ